MRLYAPALKSTFGQRWIRRSGLSCIGVEHLGVTDIASTSHSKNLYLPHSIAERGDTRSFLPCGYSTDTGLPFDEDFKPAFEIVDQQLVCVGSGALAWGRAACHSSRPRRSLPRILHHAAAG